MMLPRGRPPGPGTTEERAAIRREKVRLNVKAYRERKRNALAAAAKLSPSSDGSRASPSRSNYTTPDSSYPSESDDQRPNVNVEGQIVIQPKVRPAAEPRPIEPVTAQQPSVDEPLWIAPSAGPILSDAFLSMFRNAFLPSTVVLEQKSDRSPMLVTPCAPWITHAYGLAIKQDRGALKSGLLAIGLTLNGQQHSSTELKVASFQMHRQALHQLRNDLGPITLHRQRKLSPSSIIVSYLTCLAVAMFEMIQTGFSPALLPHIRALNSLMELLYSHPSVQRSKTDLIMEDFGMLELMICLKHGIDSALRNTRRKLKPRLDESRVAGGTKESASVYGEVLDLADELPSLVVQAHKLEAQSASEDVSTKLQEISRKLSQVQDNVDAWSAQFEKNHGSTTVEEVIRHENSGESELRHALRSYEHGAITLYALHFQLAAITANIRVVSVLAEKPRGRDSHADLSQERTTGQSTSIAQANIPPMSNSIQKHGNVSSIASTGYRYSALSGEVKGQRAKLRETTLRLVHMMDMFSKVSNNLTGRAILIEPCEQVSSALNDEKKRLNNDLRHLESGDYQGAIEINMHLRDITAANERFKKMQSEIKTTG